MIDNSYCIFTSSKYYEKAVASANDIAQPISYEYLSKKSNQPINRVKGQLQKIVLFQRPIIKTISNKKTPLEKVSEHLLITQAKRKNTYLSSNPMSIINKSNNQLNQEMTSIFIPDFPKDMLSTIQTVNAFHQVLSQETYTSIKNYSLSKYFIYYDGSNTKTLDYFYQLFNEELLEYHISTITRQCDHMASNSRVGLPDGDIKTKQSIQNYLQRVKKQGQIQDPLFSGVHLFIGQSVATTRNYDYLKQEIQNLPYLQYYLYLFCGGILADGQNAIIKLRGSIRHKTVDFLFLYKLLFSKVTLVKPNHSNFISTQKYMVLQGFIKQNASIVYQYLKENFDLLSSQSEQRLLVNPQLIFRQEVLAENVRSFNDSLITKGLKQVIDLYLKNSNLEIHQNKTQLLQKIQSFHNYQEFFKETIRKVQEKITSQEEIKAMNENQQTNKNSSNFTDNRNRKQNYGHSNKPEKNDFQEKQAGMNLMDFMKVTQTAKHQQPVKAKPIQDLNDQDEIERNLMKKYQQQEKIRQQMKKRKKQKEKKQKQRKKQYANEPQPAAHFEYAQN